MSASTTTVTDLPLEHSPHERFDEDLAGLPADKCRPARCGPRRHPREELGR